MIFEQHITGGDRNFGYLIGDKQSKECALIDPSYNPDLLVNRAKAQGLKVTWILNTHLHADHTNGNDYVKKIFSNAAIGAYPKLNEGDEILIGKFPIKVMFVPGHSPDHLVFYQPNFKIAFTGDHLFVGKIGGTSTEEGAHLQYKGLKRLLEELPPETTIWPGHNVGARPSSTIALEKATNPFLTTKDYNSFLEMKREWPAYKAKNGLL